MEGKTHILSALAVHSAVSTLIYNIPVIDIHNLSGTSMANFIAVGAVIAGAVAPDLDIPNSYASSKMTLVNIKIVKAIMNLVLVLAAVLVLFNARNQYVLYGGLGLILFTLITYSSLSRKILSIARTVIQYGFVAFLAYMFFKTGQIPYICLSIVLLLYISSKHRGLSHTVVLSLAAACTIYYSLMYWGKDSFAFTTAGYFLLGVFTHIYFNDFLTNRGVPNPLYPLLVPVKLIALAVKKGKINSHVIKESFKIDKIRFLVTFETGGFIELVISFISIVIIIVCLVI